MWQLVQLRRPGVREVTTYDCDFNTLKTFIILSVDFTDLFSAYITNLDDDSTHPIGTYRISFSNEGNHISFVPMLYAQIALPFTSTIVDASDQMALVSLCQNDPPAAILIGEQLVELINNT